MAKQVNKAQDQKEQIRLQAEADLEFFIRLIHPQRVIGSIHIELILWWNRQEAKTHQLVLLPRDHGKSAYCAYRVAWELTRNPTLRFLYISSTANLAIKQLKFIKDILTHPIYRRYWPDMVHPDEGKREKWTETEISVDHPLRKAEAIRDPSVFAAGLTTNVVGMHCDINVLDDVVVDDNAYKEEGRERVRQQYSYLSSVEGTEARQWVVGTRYHPKDLYNDLIIMQVDMFSEEGEKIDSYPLYEIFERRVEDVGDGTGQFLWPVQTRYDGKRYGFNTDILSRKKAQYLDRVKFRAQYYNDPNDPEEAGINRDSFQYYDKSNLSRSGSYWYVKGKRLNVFASVDFAFSIKQRADSTAIIVVGIDADRNYYVLDIDRFKTVLISDYFKHILTLHQKWDFRKLRAEVSVAQRTIVEDLKASYIRPHGLALTIEDFQPSRKEGTKEERITAVLQPRYANRQIWHYQGGHCQTLEEELVLQNPPHDDIKDALATCIDFCVSPSQNFGSVGTLPTSFTHNRFGGIA